MKGSEGGAGESRALFTQSFRAHALLSVCVEAGPFYLLISGPPVCPTVVLLDLAGSYIYVFPNSITEVDAVEFALEYFFRVWLFLRERIEWSVNLWVRASSIEQCILPDTQQNE
jgi:hypothetical protein